MITTASDDDQGFLDAVTAFADRTAPTVHDRDAAGDYPADLIPELRNLGLFAASDRPLPIYALALEEIGRAWLSLVPIVNAHTTSVWSLKRYGTQEQQEYWLPRLRSGSVVAALGLTEPQGGTDLGNLLSTATRTSDGWHVRAHKTLITHAAHAGALLVLVRTDPDATRQHHGLSLILLEQGEWEVDRELPKLGSRGIETCELHVDVHVSADRLIGVEAGQGFKQVMDGLEVGRIAVAAAAVGVGRSALWNAVEYARTRTIGGVPVAENAAVRARIAQAANDLAAAKAVTAAAAVAKQRGGRHDVPASAAKMLAADAAVHAGLLGIELGGGWGYIEDLDFARLLRDSALFIAGEGANGALADLVGRAVVRGQPSLDWI